MPTTELVSRILAINCGRRGAEVAPYKPVMLLYALSKVTERAPRLISYAQVDKDLGDLFREYRKSASTSYPFFRLKHDGIWELEGAEKCRARASNIDPPKSELLHHDVKGGFKRDVYDALSNDPVAIKELTKDLLARIPESFRQSVEKSLGLRRA